jgi:hypothetical protein
MSFQWSNECSEAFVKIKDMFKAEQSSSSFIVMHRTLLWEQPCINGLKRGNYSR